jgi:hypothetical protein
MKYGYLVTGLSVPEGSKDHRSTYIMRSGRKVTQHYLRASRVALKAIGCLLKTVLVVNEQGNPFLGNETPSRRHVIVFGEGEASDNLSERIADAFQGAFLLSMGLLPHEEPFYLLKFPLNLINTKSMLNLQSLRRYHTENIEYFDLLSFEIIMHKNVAVGEDRLRNIFRLVPVLISSEKLLLSAGFLAMSHRDFCMPRATEILSDPGFVPPTRFEKCAFENALHNAYKSVEVIIGDPPKKEKKLLEKFVNAGIDPLKKMKKYDSDTGKFGDRSYYEFVREFKSFRNAYSAHGSTNLEDRKITIIELWNYQSLAWNILWTALEFQQRKLKEVNPT